MSNALLSVNEKQKLADLEDTIERGMKTFIEVGAALYAIRDERLYRTEYETFESYCRDRWGFSDSRARQLIGAASTVTNVTDEGLPAPENEGQARELSRVPESDRAEVWRRTLERTDGKPTAAAIQEAADEPEIVDAEIVPERAPRAPRTDVVGTLSTIVRRAEQAAELAEKIKPAHLKKDNSAHWHRVLKPHVEELSRLLKEMEKHL